jgi:DNA-binding CsgD family transcriptional regulator
LIAEQIVSSEAAGLGMVVKMSQWALATLYNGRGQYERALAAATDAMAQPWEWSSQIFLHELVEAAARCESRDLAEDAVERLAASVDVGDTDWGLGVLARCRALLADDLLAEDLYLEALERLSRTELRPDLARTHLVYGEWLRRVNRRVDARTQLRTAHDMFAAMGMRAFGERARLELLATGETVRKRSLATYDELTPQEAHIARLASEGHTNPEIGTQLFISPRTVEWHMKKVFTKLDISSRRELREVLLRRSAVAVAE